MYYYEVNFYDEVNEKETIEKGVVCGATYSEATDKIIKYYGQDNTFSIKLEDVTADDIIPEEDIRHYFN